MSALIMAIHRVSQRSLPMLLIGASHKLPGQAQHVSPSRFATADRRVALTGMSWVCSLSFSQFLDIKWRAKKNPTEAGLSRRGVIRTVSCDGQSQVQPS